MQISAKATFLGFAQSLDPHTGLLEIAGVRIALAHTGGAAAGDVLQVDAVRDHEGAWSGVVTACLAHPEIERACALRAGQAALAPQVPTAEPPRPTVQPVEEEQAPRVDRARRFASVNSATTRAGAPVPAAQAREAPVPAPASASAPAPAPAPARRFGVSSAAPRPTPGAQAPARPRFSPTAADERVSY